MAERKKPFWEESYARPGKLDTFGGGQPSKMVERIASALPAGLKALDVACGEGRNAIYLAGFGYQVSAFDISQAGIAKLRAAAEERNLTVDASVADMNKYQFPHKFDLIVCMGCLHLVTRQEWQAFIPRMKASTAPGGIHIVGAFTDTLPEPEDLRGLMVGLFKEGELAKQYADWEILERRDYQFKDNHPGGIAHEHAANEIAARQP
jgi:tellurite methyltransferase